MAVADGFNGFGIGFGVGDCFFGLRTSDRNRIFELVTILCSHNECLFVSGCAGSGNSHFEARSRIAHGIGVVEFVEHFHFRKVEFSRYLVGKSETIACDEFAVDSERFDGSIVALLGINTFLSVNKTDRFVDHELLENQGLGGARDDFDVGIFGRVDDIRDGVVRLHIGIGAGDDILLAIQQDSEVGTDVTELEVCGGAGFEIEGHRGVLFLEFEAEERIVVVVLALVERIEFVVVSRTVSGSLKGRCDVGCFAFVDDELLDIERLGVGDSDRSGVVDRHFGGEVVDSESYLGSRSGNILGAGVGERYFGIEFTIGGHSDSGRVDSESCEVRQGKAVLARCEVLAGELNRSGRCALFGRHFECYLGRRYGETGYLCRFCRTNHLQ